MILHDGYFRSTNAKARRPRRKRAFVPFVLNEYIRNPIRVMRIEAGLNKSQFARRLGVSQGYVSRIEGRNFKVSERLLARAKAALRRR